MSQAKTVRYGQDRKPGSSSGSGILPRGIRAFRSGSGIGSSIDNVEAQIDTLPISKDKKQELQESFGTLKEHIQLAFQGDVVFYRIVVIGLTAAILLVVVAIAILVGLDKTGSYEALTAIGSAAVGGLVGLLAPSPIGSK